MKQGKDSIDFMLASPTRRDAAAIFCCGTELEMGETCFPPESISMYNCVCLIPSCRTGLDERTTRR